MITRTALLGSLLSILAAACAAEAPPPAPAKAAPVATPTPATPTPTPAGPLRSGLERFRMTGDEAGCPEQARGDCVAAIDLTAAGALELDPWGAPGVGPLTATLDRAELEALEATLTAAELLALLDRKATCEDARETETMQVTIAGAAHRGATGRCNDAPIQAARGAMISLAAKHFPGNHLISPPF
jgi:hypothetical protein